MQKTGKKILLALLALALSLGVLAGCNGAYRSDPLDGYTPSENAAESNGGFVVKKDEWYYFINGAEDYSADNTYGNAVKGSLMRISETDLAAGNYGETDIVVPQLIVAQDYTSGIYIYGDYVYYATPNTTRNMEGTIESSYLDFKRSKLDGSETMSNYYVQVSDNTTAYRYVQVDGTVYLLYVDSSATEIHSYNTVTGANTVLVSGYTDYEFDTSDPESSTVYYTMPVAKKNTYSSGSAQNESYNQLWKADASATASPYTFDLSDGYTDPALSEGDEGYEMEYVNLGTLVLDGIGSNKTDASPFNVHWKSREDSKSAGGFSYALVKYTEGRLLLTVTNLDASDSAFVYSLNDSSVGSDWTQSITANPDLSGTSGNASALSLVAVTSDAATSSALYYEQDGSLYYLYLNADSAIARVKVGENGQDAETVLIAKQQGGATLLYLKDGYLYYSMSGTNGNALWRIRYDGAAEDYNIFTGAAYDNDDYKPTQYLQIDYNSSWYAPETIGDYLFFSNAEEYGDNYVYVFRNAGTNAELKALNDRYEEVQDLFTSVEEQFADAANAIRYYYYVGNDDVFGEEVHRSEYQAEDLEILEAYISCGSAHGFAFSVLKEGDVACNVQTAFYSQLGYRSETDAEDLADTLVADLVLGSEEETASSDNYEKKKV